jgi:glycosyltransferase involved in cell wall biosynthesis
MFAIAANLIWVRSLTTKCLSEKFKTMSQPLVSFCVTTYNTENYVSDCLDSILNQEGGYNFEIIIVDDASTDRTEEVVQAYKDDNRIRYIRHAQNQGAFVTVNRGFEEAQGQFIARIDSDDRYKPNFLALTIPILEQYPEVGLVYGDIAMMDESGKITSAGNNVRRNNRKSKGNELIPLLTENYLPAPTTIAKREAWADALPVPEGYSFCDWYLSLEIAKKWEFFYVDSVLADYRIHSQNMHRTMTRDKMGERITFQVLDRVFSAADCQAEMQAVRSHIYAKNYYILAEKYFGCQMISDARRCYLKAIYHQPSLFLDLSFLRHLTGTLLGNKIYQTSKAISKSVLGLKSNDTNNQY